MNEYIKENIGELKRPVFAFVTFTNQEGVERVTKYVETKRNLFY